MEDKVMLRYFAISIICGVLFGVMDALINANPLGRKLNEAFKPIAKTSMNIAAGVIIDLAYGFALAIIFVVLFDSLPGIAGLLKGISFAILVWFFRVVMSTASNWMMYKVPGKTLLYNLLTGLVKMLVLGLICGAWLRPWF
jgi:hypothetical protein